MHILVVPELLYVLFSNLYHYNIAINNYKHRRTFNIYFPVHLQTLLRTTYFTEITTVRQTLYFPKHTHEAMCK